MQLTAVPAPVASAPASLVADLLPKVPGLPGHDTPGWSMGDLPAPPAEGSLAGKLDLGAVQAAQRLRTPERDAWANRMADEGVTKIWTDFAKRHRDGVGPVQGWVDTALLAATLAANAGVTAIAKEKFDRRRPFLVDPSIDPPVHRPMGDSYPSGHTSSAFAAARVIATLSPTLADEAYDMARQVGISRVYAGVHFPTDVVAGAKLGVGIADAVLRAAGRDDAAAAVELLEVAA